MNDIFNDFDNAFLSDNFLADITAAENGQGEQRDVPTGKYEVKIEKMELTKSKAGDPMFTCWFRIIKGEFEKQIIFMNQLTTRAFQIHIVNEFLRSLKTKQEITFVSFSQWGQLIKDAFNEITEAKTEFALDYSENAKGFKEFKIFEVFEATPF